MDRINRSDMVNQMARLFVSYNQKANAEISLLLLMQTEMLLTLEGGVELAILLVDSLVTTMMQANVHLDPAAYLKDISDRVTLVQTTYL